jgi:hypothetical protein
MKLLIMYLSSASCYFLPFGPNSILSILISNTLGPHFTLAKFHTHTKQPAKLVMYI